MNKLLTLLFILPMTLVTADGDCCKVDGGLTEWTQFTPCSTSCDPGDKRRERFCTAPYPQHGGKDCSGPLKETVPCNLRPCPKWELKCGACALDANGACARTCKQECRLDGKPVDDCYCPGKSLEKVSLCHPSECPRFEWKYDCAHEKSKSCFGTSLSNCHQKCTQTCFNVHTGAQVANDKCKGNPETKNIKCQHPKPELFCPIHEWRYDNNCADEKDKLCSGQLPDDCRQSCTQTCFNVHTNKKVANEKCKHLGKPKTKQIKCQHPKKEGCGPNPIYVCTDCKDKALEKAKTLNDPYQKANFVGHACRDSEVQADLWEHCQKNKAKQSTNGGLPANDWFWVHCSADGPWCKPCAVRTLVFNTKCDACEISRNSTCTGKHSGK